MTLTLPENHPETRECACVHCCFERVRLAQERQKAWEAFSARLDAEDSVESPKVSELPARTE